MTDPRTPAEPHRFDHAVAAAADAWIRAPEDYLAYARLVQAVRRRRQWLNPQLAAEEPPVDVDETGGEEPARLGEGLMGAPAEILEHLRASDPARPSAEAADGEDESR